jgi:hypothetical protein
VTKQNLYGEGRNPSGLFDRERNLLTAANDQAVRRALEAAGVEFIDENAGAGSTLAKAVRALMRLVA